MSEPRPSATICAFHDAAVLMVRRASSARFMPGTWVFPGGTVDDQDRSDRARALMRGLSDSPIRPWVVAALREMAEEVGVWVTSPRVAKATSPGDVANGVFGFLEDRGMQFDATDVAYIARWITPALLPVRFDTRFFVATLDASPRPVPDMDEVDAALWIKPDEALARSRDPERAFRVAFPTRKMLEMFSGLGDGSAALAHARQLSEVVPVRPRVRLSPDGVPDVLIPGDPGFDEVEEGDPLDEQDQAVRAITAAGRRPPPEAT